MEKYTDHPPPSLSVGRTTQLNCNAKLTEVKLTIKFHYIAAITLPWSVYKSAKSFFSLSIFLIAPLRYQILIFLEMKFKVTLVVIAVFKN